jgi:hypothetical protein
VSDTLSKDNVLFAVIGILVGFIAGYLLHELMAVRQPPRRIAGMEATAPAAEMATPGGEQAPGAPGGAPPEGGTAPMQEIQKLRAYVESHPNDTEALLKLANLNFDIRNWRRSLELYNRYLKLKPNDPDALSDVGFCYREMKQFDQALARFHQAQQADPKHWQSYFNEAVVLGIDLKEYTAAEKVLAKLRELQPGNADVSQLAAEIERRKSAPTGS